MTKVIEDFGCACPKLDRECACSQKLTKTVIFLTRLQCSCGCELNWNYHVNSELLQQLSCTARYNTARYPNLSPTSSAMWTSFGTAHSSWLSSLLLCPTPFYAASTWKHPLWQPWGPGQSTGPGGRGHPTAMGHRRRAPTPWGLGPSAESPSKMIIKQDGCQHTCPWPWAGMGDW